MNYLYAEAKFTFKWPHPFQLTQTKSYKVQMLYCPAKIRHYKHIYKDMHFNKQWDINKINNTAIIMHIVVMNNENCVATHPRTVVQFNMKDEITTKIYSASKFNTLINVHYEIVWFWTLSFVDFFRLCVLFYSYLKLFVAS